MQAIAATAEDGVLVAQNLDTLSGAINSSQTSFVINSDIFAAGNVVIIDQERILIGTDVGNGSYTGCTRGYESTTPAAHVTSSIVRLKGGTSVLSHTFNGSTRLSKVQATSMEQEAQFGLMIGGVLKDKKDKSAYNELAVEFPFVAYVPASGTIVKVVAWCPSAINCFASMQS